MKANILGFTAEQTLYKSTVSYCVQQSIAVANSTVLPQWPLGPAEVFCRRDCYIRYGNNRVALKLCLNECWNCDLLTIFLGVLYPQHPRCCWIGGHFTEPRKQKTHQSLEIVLAANPFVRGRGPMTRLFFRGGRLWTFQESMPKPLSISQPAHWRYGERKKPHRFYREVLCALRHDRGVSAPGHQDVTVLWTLTYPMQWKEVWNEYHEYARVYCWQLTLLQQ